MNLRTQNLIKTLGPGILFASTAIGVSHLVQSTRAGAMAGWGLVWAVGLANVAKYPFFEFGSRYASATGTSLIAGYRKMGKWAAWVFLLLTLLTCFFVLGAIGLVTAAFLDNLLGVSIRTGTNATSTVAVVVIAGSTLVLAWGAYAALDRLIKVIAAVLLIGTLVAFAAATWHTSPFDVPPPPADFSPWTGAGLAFLIALIGWMPSAVDLASWNSIWTLERIAETGYRPTLQQTLREFNWGYWISAGLALLFLGLGAMILYVDQTALPTGTAAFAAGIVDIYTEALGAWARPFIAAAAFSAMLGTIIACLDGYTRSLSASILTLRHAPDATAKADVEPCKSRRLERGIGIGLATGSLALILWRPNDIKTLVDIATTLSFLVAPFVAAANWYLVSSSDFPKDARPSWTMQILSLLGMLFLVGFSILYLTQY
jgi:Mn2+/Fe2+ NRAMP family transporter